MEEKKAKMGLENVFQEKVEKLPKEKKLEVITSKKATIKDLESYFEQNKYEGSKDVDYCRKYLSSCMNFLKSFKLRPEIIREFNTKAGNVEKEEVLGLYLSALIQASYNQDHNNFVFDNISANCFGSLLKGQAENPIKITVETLKGDWSLWRAKNCSLTVNVLEGVNSLCGANSCLAEIKNYKGPYFGYEMENCVIKSKNKEILEMIKSQVSRWHYSSRWNNRFELKK